ncbi:MAG: VOC family protein [Nitrococcus sp.]|nr:VOC family protein [Nitrococcus sp.]
MSHGIQQLLRIGRNTGHLERALVFYRDALGFRLDRVSSEPPAWTRLPRVDGVPSRCARLSLGAQQIELTEYPDIEPYPANSTSCDLWFQHGAIVVNDMDAAFGRAMRCGAKPITQGGPQLLPSSSGAVTAFKFRDPDGHPLELLAFPPGAGDPLWQSPRPTQPTLGIDHSALSVADVERSIRFYELLGLHVVARGVNRGVEQQRLDALAQVEVDVIAMQTAAARTPHLELLGYRKPRARIAPPTPLTAIARDRLVWRVDAIDVLLDAITAAHSADAIIATRRGTDHALLRDPDGHLQILTATES